jgi:pyruvate dehydrogenase E1 component alpha subunit
MQVATASVRRVESIRQPQESLEPLRGYYRMMLLIRRFEEKASQLYGMGLIGGFCHLYIGQEAVVVGIHAVLEPVDSVVSYYRDHGQMLCMGMEADGVMAELTGRSGGYSRGKGGSMHMFSREKNFLGGHGIVGAQVPIGTGIAFAHKYKNDGGVCIVYMGDGAANQGQTFESFNMAALWKLPIVYVIENNKYAMGTSVQRHAAGDLYRRGEPFGIEGYQVDGMDILKVRAMAEQAVAHARTGRGPVLLEVDTYRYRGHSMSDPAKYRAREEVDKWRSERDPIDSFRGRLLENDFASEDDLKLIEREVKDIVATAATFAQTSPEPSPEELWTDVLV